MCRARPSGGKHTVVSDSAEIRDDLLTIIVGLSSLKFINLTAAAIWGGDLHCQVFVYYNVDCLMEQEGKGLNYPNDSTERRS